MANTRKTDALDWDWIETKCADDALSTTHFRALIELRDRVEALEAQQRLGWRPLNTETVYGSEPAVDTVRAYSYSIGPAKPIEEWGKGHTLVEAQHAHADVTRLSDAEREQLYAEMAKPATEWLPSTALIHGGSPAASTEDRPVGLVEMVAEAMQPGTFDWSAYEPEARAAIRAVADWFTTIAPRGSEAWRMASEVLLQELGND